MMRTLFECSLEHDNAILIYFADLEKVFDPVDLVKLCQISKNVGDHVVTKTMM